MDLSHRRAPEKKKAEIMWYLKFIIFCLYFIFSIVAAGLLLGLRTSECKIKYTYQQLPMAHFLSDPYYVSSGILRPPPRSLHEVLEHQADPYTQFLSDVAAFPVGIADPVSNAPFLPIQLRLSQKPWTLAEFMDQGLGRDLKAVLDNEIKGNRSSDIYANLVTYLALEKNLTMYPMIDQDLQASLAVVKKALEKMDTSNLQLGISVAAIMTSIIEHFLQTSSDVTFYLEKDGNITFPASYHLSDMDTEQNDKIRATLLGRGLMAASRGDNMVPNLGRCLSSKVSDLAQREASLIELADMTVYSHRKGSCLANSQPLLVDVTSNSKTSLILFSSNNALFLVFVVACISASFYLTSSITHTDNATLQTVFAAGLMVWYMFFAGTVLACMYVAPHVPANNVFLALALGLLSVSYQVMYTLQGDENVKEKLKIFSKRFGSSKVKPAAGYQQGGFVPLMQLCVQGHNDLSTSLYGLPRARCSSSMRQPCVTTGDPFHPLASRKKRDAHAGSGTGEADKSDQYEHEWVNMAMTWPLLYVAMACSASAYVTTYSVQQLYVVILAFYLSNAAFPKHKGRETHEAEIRYLSAAIFMAAMLISVGLIATFVGIYASVELSYTNPAVPVSPTLLPLFFSRRSLEVRMH